jgi:hypothetical protein
MRSLFILFLSFCCLAATTSTASAGSKSPAVAGLMSVILPGAGHLYTQQTTKGLTLMGTYAGAAALVFAYGPWTWEKPSSGDFAEFNTGTSTTTKIIWYGAVATAGGVLIYSVIDAIGTAKKLNSGKLSIMPDWFQDSPGLKITLAF